jgi:hypothetical protein
MGCFYNSDGTGEVGRVGFRDFRVDYTDEESNTITLNGLSNVRVTLKKEAKSNSAEITLNNYAEEYIFENEPIFKEGETLNIYATEGVVNTSNDAHLLGTFVILDTELSPDERKIKLICSDNTYKMLANLYTNDVDDKVDNIVFNIAQTTDQTGNEQNSVTTNISALNSLGVAFPIVNYTSLWKTAYEAITELSQTTYTGDDRPYIFWFDSDGTFNWVYPSQTHEVREFTHGQDEIVKMKFTKSESATINMLIYDAGEDKNGQSILDFEYRKDAGSIKGSIKFQPMTEIREEVKRTYILTNGQVAYDALSNDDFVALCKLKAKPKSQAIIAKVGQGLWKCDTTIYGSKLVPGTLYKTKATRIGFPVRNLRLDTVIHTMNSNGWSTKITLLEDVSPEEQ